ncbi:MAG: nucleoside kinase [Acidobacteria bacterium]|nr:nucleoside kinase [Acidobacteriota bacterium]
MNNIVPGVPRTSVQATFPDGSIFEAPPGTPVGDILRVAYGSPEVPMVAAIVNGRLRELTWPLSHDSDVTPLSAGSTDGARIYRRSIVFLMVVAKADVFPDADVYIEHSATTTGAYFCETLGGAPFTQDDLAALERRMREIVAEDVPITRSAVPVAEAIELFRGRGEGDTARLLAHRARPTIELYSLKGRRDFFQGYMVPSTGCLRYFALQVMPPGFMLQFPHQQTPTVVTPTTPYPKLFAVFEQAGHWHDRLGIRNVGALNDSIVAGRLPEISLVSEALHEAGLARIADEIASSSRRIRVVLIAGPSSSGKTTFSKRLAIQLLANGLRPLPLGLDDYFVDRSRTPRDASGEYDYETIRALDLDLFNAHLRSLIDGRPTDLPRYNFITGNREAGPTITLEPDHLIIVEGIHGLNPELATNIPPESVFRIYVSALTQLNLDRHNRVSTSDCRLIRRTVRDASARGYNATDTLRRWPAVMRGEKQHIFCFQENADAVFNSSLTYEMAVLRPFAEPLLLQVRPFTPEFLEANRLLSFLQWFRPAQTDVVPENSILREFVGGSVLSQFQLWRTPSDQDGPRR